MGGERESKMTKVFSIKKAQDKMMQFRPEHMNYECRTNLKSVDFQVRILAKLIHI